jgi:maltose/moltooligosaccharide transporter
MNYYNLMKMAHQETKIADANAKESSLLDIWWFQKNAYHHATFGYNFSWFGLLNVVFTTPAIAHHIYASPISDSKSEAYQNAGDWVESFGITVSAFYAFALPYICKKIGRKLTHSILNYWWTRINFHLFCTQWRLAYLIHDWCWNRG